MASLSTTPKTECFCTYDIRAIVGEDFNEATYQRLGRAWAVWLNRRGLSATSSPWVALGYDARVHSPQLAGVLVESLRAEGISVLTLGMVPSPLVYFAEHYLKENALGLPHPSAAVVVTASHNPAPYNGAKFTYGGLSISSDELLEIKAIFASSQADPGPAVFGAGLGEHRHWDPIASYIDWSVAQFGQFSTRPKVVIDSGNGTAGVVAPQLLKALNCEVISLFEEPDGRFPNHHPDPCQHKNLQDLVRTVREQKADVGIAFDGDSDRLGVVDSDGRIITGDFLLLLYAQDLLRQPGALDGKKPIVVSEVKCSQHLFDQIDQLGGEPIMSPTGHAYIKNRMKQVDAVLGGELSGHMFFRDRHWGFDDAVYAALRLVSLLDTHRQQVQGAGLADLTRRLPVSNLSEEKRVYLAADARETVLANLLAQVRQNDTFAGYPVLKVETIDGIRLGVAGGFWLVRLSNTEPCLTLRAEGETQAQMQALESALVEALYGFIREALPAWSPENPGVTANH